MSFCNFYRRFIKDFSQIVKVLTRMIKKKIEFEWIAETNEAFEVLKKRIIEISVLRHYDRSRKIILECDSSNWCLREVLSQYDDEKVFHFVVFYSKKMILAECNYEIYDKKLLTIIKCLKHWKFELKDIDESVKIYIDHKSLEIFMIFKKFISRQIRWAEILANYNIQIQYQSSVKNVKADALTRMSDYRLDENDERQRYRKQILLSLFRIKNRSLQLNALILCPIDVENDLYEVWRACTNVTRQKY